MTQDTLDGVREVVESTGGRLLSFVHLPWGVHPYLVVVFVEREQSVGALLTSLSWGRVRTKWAVAVDPLDVSTLVQTATDTFECSRGQVDGFLLGATLVHWSSGEQVICNGGWFSEEGAAFADQVQPILERAKQTYEAHR